MYSRLSRCCTAGESSTRCSLLSPTKVKARKSFLFTKKFPCIENKEHLVDFVITLSPRVYLSAFFVLYDFNLGSCGFDVGMLFTQNFDACIGGPTKTGLGF